MIAALTANSDVKKGLDESHPWGTLLSVKDPILTKPLANSSTVRFDRRDRHRPVSP
jgi:hypothetical protein